MTIQQLKYISAVEKYGSISKAAQKLYVSQPGVSAVIHALEEELGIEIFVRSAKGITITEQGRELLKMGNKILNDVDYIGEFFSAPGKEAKPSFYVARQHYDFVSTAFEQFVRSADAQEYSFGLLHGQTAEILENDAFRIRNQGGMQNAGGIEGIPSERVELVNRRAAASLMNVQVLETPDGERKLILTYCDRRYHRETAERVLQLLKDNILRIVLK